MSEWSWVIAAYAVTWAVIGGYTIYLARVVHRARVNASATRAEASS